MITPKMNIDLLIRYCQAVGFISFWFGFLLNQNIIPELLSPSPRAEEITIISDPIDTLPVVVHVIHTGTPVGSPDNPSDGQINSLIQLMNDAFQKNGPFYGGADLQLAFELAKQTPECEITNGIIRVNGSGVSNYVTGGITTDTNFIPGSAHEIFIKNLSRWPNTDFINIWIVNMIDDNPDWPGGYAYYPQYNSALTDGIVLRASVVNGMNKTIIHELGHYFNLAHTFGNAWGDCIAEVDCLLDGDQVCDTENCRYAFACSEIINPCTNEEWIVVDNNLNYTVLNNYMGYTDCQWMFTEDQKESMLIALYDFRSGLLSSNALQSSPGEIPVEACVPDAINDLSPYYGIEQVELGTLNVYSNTSLADGDFYFDHSCNQQVSVRAGDNMLISITGSYQNPHHIKVYFDFDGDGEFQVPGELVLDGDGGIVENTIVIPFSAQLCTPLRIRVVADDIDAPEPSGCLLTGTVGEGVGQIEDYAAMIKPRLIESVASGDWDDPDVWSCNCIPSATDGVVIKSGNLVIVPLALGNVYCAEVQLQPGAELRTIGNLHVEGGCD